MKKGLFGLLIMWCSIINAYAQEDTTSVEKPEKCYGGTRCSITRLGLWGFDVHKDDRLILSADFDNGQMLSLAYNVNSGLNVPLAAVCNVPSVALSFVPPQKWLL